MKDHHSLAKVSNIQNCIMGKLRTNVPPLRSILGKFTRYINNTCDVLTNHCETGLKAETFAHYSYIKCGKQVMVLGFQGAGFELCDLENSSTQLYADDLMDFLCR